jgi:hypothetical protein
LVQSSIVINYNFRLGQTRTLQNILHTRPPDYIFLYKCVQFETCSFKYKQILLK